MSLINLATGTSIGGAEGDPEAANHEPGQVVQVRGALLGGSQQLHFCLAHIHKHPHAGLGGILVPLHTQQEQLLEHTSKAEIRAQTGHQSQLTRSSWSMCEADPSRDGAGASLTSARLWQIQYQIG